jgi:membrane protein YqaA with SNARE-associated domain
VADSGDVGVLPRTPPEVPPRLKRIILVAVALSAGTAAVGTALSPYLLVEHPLILIGLNPDSRHLVLVANRVELWQAALVGTLRRGLNFLATYGLASLYGYVLITWFEKKRPWAKRIVQLVERVYARIGIWLVILVPLYSIAILSGIARVRVRRFCLAIIPGQIAFVMAILWFGEAIEHWTDPIIAFVSRHVVATTVAFVILVAVQQAWTRWRKSRRPADEPDLPL